MFVSALVLNPASTETFISYTKRKVLFIFQNVFFFFHNRKEIEEIHMDSEKLMDSFETKKKNIFLGKPSYRA